MLHAIGTAYTIVVPRAEERYTELYLLTEGPDGDLVGSGYPTEFVVGEGQELVVGVRNHEFEPIEYTLIVELQGVSRRSDRADVLGTRELHRFELGLSHNETWRQRHRVVANEAGQDRRLQYLLYRGAPPAQPTRENAYRRPHLWIDVVQDR